MEGLRNVLYLSDNTGTEGLRNVLYLSDNTGIENLNKVSLSNPNMYVQYSWINVNVYVSK